MEHGLKIERKNASSSAMPGNSNSVRRNYLAYERGTAEFFAKLGSIGTGDRPAVVKFKLPPELRDKFEVDPDAGLPGAIRSEENIPAEYVKGYTEINNNRTKDSKRQRTE